MQLSDSLRGNSAETNKSELAALTSYALAFPDNFLALVDTYDVSAQYYLVPIFLSIAHVVRHMNGNDRVVKCVNSGLV